MDVDDRRARAEEIASDPPEQYKRLGNPALVEKIGEMEERLRDCEIGLKALRQDSESQGKSLNKSVRDLSEHIHRLLERVESIEDSLRVDELRDET